MSATPYSIREMTADDIPAVMEIERECFPSPWSRNMFLCQLALDGAAVNLVLQSRGKVRGYLTAWFGYGEIHILSIAVTASVRGKGGAGELLFKAVERGREAGCERVVLEVRVGNDRARRFYEKHGFIRVGRRTGYYAETGEDALLYEKRIPGEGEGD